MQRGITLSLTYNWAMSKKVARYNGTAETVQHRVRRSDAIFDDDLRWCVMLVDLIARETLVKRRINIGAQSKQEYKITDPAMGRA